MTYQSPGLMRSSFLSATAGSSSSSSAAASAATSDTAAASAATSDSGAAATSAGAASASSLTASASSLTASASSLTASASSLTGSVLVSSTVASASTLVSSTLVSSMTSTLSAEGDSPSKEVTCQSSLILLIFAQALIYFCSSRKRSSQFARQPNTSITSLARPRSTRPINATMNARKTST